MEENMNIYLVQHAEAKREDQDPSRPLSEKGLQDIQKVASYVSRLNIGVDAILHSTKLRARQTAEILFAHLKPLKGISETDSLSPLDDPHVWGERLKKYSDSVILVGHLPHLARLASLLLCGNPDRNAVSFRMAGMVCLESSGNNTWALQWMLTPETVIGEKGPDTICDGL